MARDGTGYERLAARFMERQGFKVLQRNFRCRLGELDLVCESAMRVVFVEVRYRSRGDYGGAAASVTRAKQRRLIKAAQAYLQKHPRLRRHSCRFDVLAMTPAAAAPDQVHVQWLPGAFTV